MEKKKLKNKVLSWLLEHNLVPKEVRVFNTRRNGLEVRLYCPPMEYVTSKITHRKIKGTTVDTETGFTYTRTTGRHNVRIPMYVYMNEQILSSDEEKKFTLDLIKSSVVMKNKVV